MSQKKEEDVKKEEEIKIEEKTKTPKKNRPKPPNSVGRIILLIDGTLGCDMDRDLKAEKPTLKEREWMKQTNICRLKNIISKSEGKIIYVRGIGSEESLDDRSLSSVRKSGFGELICDEIYKAYIQLCYAYSKGDEIILMGFSRGAFCAKILSHFICVNGIVKKEEIQNLPVFFQRRRNLPSNFEKIVVEGSKSVKFVGLFDVVKAVAMSEENMGVFYKYERSWENIEERKIEPESWAVKMDDIKKNIKRIYHCVSLDEGRVPSRSKILKKLKFGKLGFIVHRYTWDDMKELYDSDILQAEFFAGYHSDVGGGSEPGDEAKKDKSQKNGDDGKKKMEEVGLQMLSLMAMMNELKKIEIKFKFCDNLKNHFTIEELENYNENPKDVTRSFITKHFKNNTNYFKKNPSNWPKMLGFLKNKTWKDKTVKRAALIVKSTGWGNYWKCKRLPQFIEKKDGKYVVRDKFHSSIELLASKGILKMFYENTGHVFGGHPFFEWWDLIKGLEEKNGLVFRYEVPGSKIGVIRWDKKKYSLNHVKSKMRMSIWGINSFKAVCQINAINSVIRRKKNEEYWSEKKEMKLDED